MTNDDITTVRYGTERMAVFYLLSLSRFCLQFILQIATTQFFSVPAYRINNVD